MSEYQVSDHSIVDYRLYSLPGLESMGPEFRGPAVTGGPYIACLGAAQTFGRFCARPFPVLLGERLAMESLNLGRGGAGPAFFLQPSILEHVNRARLVIVQVLSARSESNARFRTTGHMDGTRVSDGVRMIAAEFFEALLEDEPNAAPDVVQETRANYVRDMVMLLSAIIPPKILFWFSVRSPAYVEEYELPVIRLFGQFPQLVNSEMVDEMRRHADEYIECVSSRGLPRKLLDRHGRPVSVARNYNLWRPEPVQRYFEDNYYPSPEMHEEAAAALIPVCQRLLRSK